jgi:hypothetical protein
MWATDVRAPGSFSSSETFSELLILRDRHLRPARTDGGRLEAHAAAGFLLRATLHVVLTLSVTAGAALCGGQDAAFWPYFYPDDPLHTDRDNVPVTEPEYRSTSQYYDFIENMFFGVGRGDRRPAMNTNTLGQVPNSSWFTNRHGLRAMPVEEMLKASQTGDGPDMQGPWTITGAKSEGVTPGFTIKDFRGDTYFIKIDPLEHPRMSTSSEAICTPFFHAIGYNVPENYLVDLQVKNIVIGENTTIKLGGGERRRMTPRDLRSVLSLSPVNPDGTLRVIASKAIPGAGLYDHFRYYGTRPDDANDVIPHQHRRELRGLKVFSAWLNHDDTRSINTLDVFTEDGYVKHYLIDFGSCLGSGSVKPQTFRAGNEHMWEAAPTLKTMLTLGLWVRPYLKMDYPDLPEIGRFESKKFRPELWRPEYPNPAFDAMDRNDAFWAARIVMRFSDEHIRAVVENGRLEDTFATDYMIKTLIERRDKIGDYYLNQVNPLDEFKLEGDALAFENLSVKYGFGLNPQEYEVVWRGYDNRERRPLEELGLETALPGAGGSASARLPGEAAESYGYIFAEITASEEAPALWRKPVRVFLRDRSPGWEIVGIYR